MSRFEIKLDKTDNGCICRAGALRLSVLSERILRIEKSAEGKFEDRPSQSVVNRNFAKPEFNMTENGNEVVIKTNSVVFTVNKNTLAVVCEINGKKVKPSKKENLKGTARTLDMTNGTVKIGEGVMAKNGVAVYDDSKSFLLNDDGTVSPRDKGAKDIYVFAFGHDYIGGLKEFYALTGFTPLLPKYALGNWWSRYFEYTEQSYLELMDKFAAKGIPFTIATIDMDWHIVKNVPRDIKKVGNPFQSPGWTGYTFEKEFFPDHRRFFKELKKRDLAVTMNLHPRDGVRYYEEQYPEMAKINGIDPATKAPVEFDLTDKKFLHSYFDVLHHPYEDDGVDFWWIDWQQGTKSKMKGLDPLWLLNHYHYLDAGRNGRTPLILSRYGGVGSHRYPIGFSGDTIVSWKSLKLQPRFTSTASNVGYSWWSHDIGGHMWGKGDAELYLRWVQFGVFSPINRLHSTKRDYFSKEPWLYGEKAEKFAIEYLRFRHRMLPYLYTANVLTAKEGLPIMMPMYYVSDQKEAYAAEDEYMFGSELLVAPILTKGDAGGLASVKVWLPEGKWTDIITGEKLSGGTHTVTRDMSRIPVFAKEGAILPLLPERAGNSTKFDELEIRVYKGNNEYVMYDEKGSIKFKLSYGGKKGSLKIEPSGQLDAKELKIIFYDVKSAKFDCAKAIGTGVNYIVVPCEKCEIIINEN